jgi:hypothetical protein
MYFGKITITVLPCFQHLLLKNVGNLVIHLPVVQMLYAKRKTERVLALALLITMEILTLDADLNVLLTVIATDQRHVAITNVEIHVQVFVEKTPNVEFKTIRLFVFVATDMKAIQVEDASCVKLVRTKNKYGV